MFRDRAMHRLSLLAAFAAFFGFFLLEVRVRTPSDEVRLWGSIAYGYGSSASSTASSTTSSTASSASRAVQRGTAASEYNRVPPSSSARSESSELSVSPLCGNAVLDPGEACDLGSRLNGLTECSKQCQLLVCGDGIVSRQVWEECEPRKITVEYSDPETGNVATRTKYLIPDCGTYCLPPTCSESMGECAGGCRWKFQDRCPPEMQILTEAFFSSREARLRKRSSASRSSVAVSVSTPAQQTSGTGGSAVHPSCGNGAIEEGESCDLGKDNSDATPNVCRTNCAFPSCGDGVTDPLFGELCDQGPRNSDAAPNACRRTCALPACGDNVVDDGEECDGTADCSSQCRKTFASSSPLCGNGIVDAGETCDDGNVLDGDGCGASCAGELQGATNGNGVVPPRCGDGVREGEEECDDGNALPGDDCTARCELPVCGDGIRSLREECDDGNRENDDGCSSLCRVEGAHTAARETADAAALFIVLSLSGVIGIMTAVLSLRRIPGSR